MSSYLITEHFKKQLKSYLKKHRSLTVDIIRVLKEFQPDQGIALGEDTYKVRLKTQTLSRGKSKSFRLIILFMKLEDLVIPLALYFKGDQETMSRKEIRYHIEMTRLEIEN